MHSKNICNILSLIIIVTIGTLLYVNSLNGEFVWDDKDLILYNQYLNPHSIKTLLSNDFYYGNQDISKIGYFRPVISLSYLADFTLWSRNPFGFHLTNLLFHLLNCIIIFFLGLMLLKNRKASLFTTIIFLTHPIHTESVAWISGRTDLICGGFYFLSLYSFTKFIVRDYKINLFYFLALIAFILSLFSKEMAITLPFITFIYGFYFSEQKKTLTLNKICGWLPFCLIIFAYFILRIWILEIKTNSMDINKLLQSDFLLTVSSGFILYLKKLVFPLNFNAYIMMDKTSSVLNTGVILFFILIIFFLYGAFHYRKNPGVIYFSILFFTITLLPVLNIVPLSSFVDVNFPVAERFLYIPSFGFCLFFGYLIFYLQKCSSLIKKVSIITSIIIISFYCNKTINRNKDWQNELTLNQITLKSSPGASVLYNNLGNLFYNAGKINYAKAQYERALYLRPDFAEAHNNLGGIHYNKGLLEVAEKEFKKAIALKPDYADAYSNLGVVYRDRKLYEKAIVANQKALKLKPTHKTHNNLGIVYSMINANKKAINEFQKAIRLNPYFIEARFNLAKILTRCGLKKDTVSEYQKILEIEPDNTLAHLYLADLYMNNERDMKKAAFHLNKVINLSPNHPRIDKIKRMLQEIKR
ncbi:MAG: tetratricopeptide repeat protein [Thermodesulfobacteriota bacterium]|nr:tetratricopeptide repeat protein [Thermodesulfobacteriota bacterium]